MGSARSSSATLDRWWSAAAAPKAEIATELWECLDSLRLTVDLARADGKRFAHRIGERPLSLGGQAEAPGHRVGMAGTRRAGARLAHAAERAAHPADSARSVHQHPQARPREHHQGRNGANRQTRTRRGRRRWEGLHAPAAKAVGYSTCGGVQRRWERNWTSRLPPAGGTLTLADSPNFSDLLVIAAHPASISFGICRAV